MGCRLFLVRHGETVWNAQMRFQGHTDVPLSPRGIEQARALAARLQREKFAAFYASDLKRAVETARILAAPHGLAVETLVELRELHFGAWEGLTGEEIRNRYAREVEQWWGDPVSTRVPGGETLLEMLERTSAAVCRIVERFPGQQVVVVSHGGPIRALVARVLGMNLRDYWRLVLYNASLSILEFSSWEKGVLTLFNDCSHLERGAC
ncbi:alpha-ribazole phosphatase [Desulfovirgula thermocuniculi]|uniref:alpha-ribazole phosphatase n=1 Tax=Desulfovirgula thermocuniculi TaxID=348842 RepID=UPI0003F94D91|nr:alpha-ribazole phosphatase [Desulfovirgula thermocuniculi]